MIKLLRILDSQLVLSLVDNPACLVADAVLGGVGCEVEQGEWGGTPIHSAVGPGLRSGEVCWLSFGYTSPF